VTDFTSSTPILQANESTDRIWEVPDFEAPPPEWLPGLTESVALAAPNRFIVGEIFSRFDKARTDALAVLVLWNDALKTWPHHELHPPSDPMSNEP
jgi:hypothetical protein